MAISDRNVTVYGRLSYPDLFIPRAVAEDSDVKKYGATILIPKTDTDTIQRVQAAVQAAVTHGVDTGKFKQPIDPNHTKYPPLRDGDAPNANGEPRGPEFAGHWFIAAKASESKPPMVVDGQRQPIIDQTEVYAGCYVNVAVEFFPYSHNTGGKGISCSLIGVQKAKDGEPLGCGKVEVDDVFGIVPNTETPPAAPTGGMGF